MPFIPVPGAAFCAVIWRLDGQSLQTCLDVTVETETVENMQNAAIALFGGMIEFVLPQLSADIQLESSVAAGLETESSPIGVHVPITAQFGAVSASSLPNNVAYSVSKFTGLRGRSFRGRLFLPGIPENVRETPSTVTAAYRSNIATAFDGLLAHMISEGFPPVVVSRFTDNAPRTTGLATPVIQLAPVDSVLDSQRRRLPGRGS